MTDLDHAALKDSLEEIRARYRAEREKRLRPDGVAQYRSFTGIFEDFDKDPYADPDFTRDPIVEDKEVAIIGAGLGGLLTATRLAQRGITDVRIIDKAGDFGGTWYWNRYPGAACDIESYIYMPLLEETGYIPTERYAKAAEIFEHCQRIAKQFDLYEKAAFQTLVKEVRFSDADNRWVITTNRGDSIRARFLVIAGGILHKAKLPGIAGVESFKGRSFHTSRWDYDYTGGSPTTPMDKLAGKRVALIGTGATSIQVVPRLAETAGQLLVVQRTPSSIGIRGNRPTDPEWAAALKPGWQQERIDNFTQMVSGQEPEQDLIDDGWTDIFGRNPNAFGVTSEDEELLDLEQMTELRNRVDSIVSDPATAESLKPWYNRMCKRPCFHDEYLHAFNQPNVALIDTAGKGVERFTEDAMVIDGKEYPVDCIIYGSGFESGSSHVSRNGFEIYGRGGVSLTDAWAASGGPATLHGMHARGFPNLMNFHMVQSGIAINFAHILLELSNHAAWIIDYCIKHDIAEIEPAAEAQEAWFNLLLSKLGKQAMFTAQCTPGYFNGEGNMDPSGIRMIPYFGPTSEFFDILRAWREAGDLAGLETRKNEAVVG